MTSELSWHRNYAIFYMQPYFSALGTLLSKSFAGAFSSNSRVDVREVKAKSIRALSRYFGMKVFMVRNITVKIGQSWYLAVICRKWSALPFEMQFQLIASSVFLKTCVKEVHSLIFKRLSPAFDHQHHLVTWWGRWHKSEGHSVTCYCHLTISTAFGARWTTGN